MARHVYEFRERRLGKRKALPGAAHNQCGNDGKRKRNAQAQRCALAGMRIQFHLAADLFNVGANYIHADAAAADVSDCRSRGKSGQEDELQQFALGLLRGALGGDQVAFDGFRADTIDRDTCPVVSNFDDDVAAFLDRAQPQNAIGILAQRERALLALRFRDPARCVRRV